MTTNILKTQLNGKTFSGKTYIPKHFKFTLGLGLVLLLSACATTSKPKATKLAQTGQAATTSLKTSLTNISNTALLAEQMEAFTETLDRCENPRLECEIRSPDEDDARLQASRIEYSKKVALRLKALTALNSAYAAMEKDAQTDARAEMETAVSDLVTSTNLYAGAFGLPAILITETVGGIVGQASGLFASNEQAKRLNIANSIIGDATDKLAQALTAEAAAHNAVAGDLELIKRQMRDRLIKTGLSPRQNYIEPISKAVNIPLVENSEAIMRANPSLQKAVDAVLAAQARQPKKGKPSPFDAGIKSLSAMSKAHKDFENISNKDIDLIWLWVEELERASKTLFPEDENTEQSSAISTAPQIGG